MSSDLLLDSSVTWDRSNWCFQVTPISDPTLILVLNRTYHCSLIKVFLTKKGIWNNFVRKPQLMDIGLWSELGRSYLLTHVAGGGCRAYLRCPNLGHI